MKKVRVLIKIFQKYVISTANIFLFWTEDGRVSVTISLKSYQMNAQSMIFIFYLFKLFKPKYYQAAEIYLVDRALVYF